MCLINELARHNKTTHQYRLTDETGTFFSLKFTKIYRTLFLGSMSNNHNLIRIVSDYTSEKQESDSKAFCCINSNMRIGKNFQFTLTVVHFLNKRALSSSSCNYQLLFYSKNEFRIVKS